MSNRLPNQKPYLFSLTQSSDCSNQCSTSEIALPILAPRTNSAKTSILLIDDESTIRLLLGKALNAQGYSFQEASDGYTGLALFQKMQPDLVLLDISMPGMDGIAVLQEIRRQNPTVGIIMVSALNPEHMAAKTSDDGADGYVKKPFRTQTIFQEIERVRTAVHLRRNC